MATFLFVVLGLYTLWILAVLGHTNSLVVISSKNWLYRIYRAWYDDRPEFLFVYARRLILLPFHIVLMVCVLFVLTFILGCIFVSEKIFFPPHNTLKPLIVFDPPSS